MELEAKLQEWWSRLVWQSEREFVSPYNLKECVQRLNELYEKYDQEQSSLFSMFRFSISNLWNQGRFVTFKARISMSKVVLHAELFGQLIQGDAHNTRVKVRLGYTLGSIITLILLLPALYIFSFMTGRTSPFEILVVLGIYIFALIIQISFGYGLKPELYNEIHKTLAGDAQAAKPV